MNAPDKRPAIGPVSPLFIVRDVRIAVDFYRRLGFELRSLMTEEDPIFAIVGRDRAQIFLKAIGGEVLAQPNPSRHPFASWDAFVYVEDPGGFAAELAQGGVPFHKALANFEEHGLRGFEVRDADGYVLFFGRPLPE